MTSLRHAMLLTAGLGTRLGALTRVRAKPAVPVAGEPIIRRIVRQLAAAGVRDVVLNLHHLPDTITAVVGDGADLSVAARYSWEHPTILGSGGGPRHALPLIDADRFLVVNGDTLSDVDVGALATAHREAGSLVTLALTANHKPLQYGGVLLDHHARVTAFVPRGPQAIGSYHFTGIQVAEATAFRGLDDGRPLASIGGLYDDLLRSDGGSVAGFVCEAAFWDIGTVADYWRTSFAIGAPAADAPPRDLRVHPSARVHRSIIWDSVDVGADCVLDECIVTDGVRLPPGTRYARRILIQRGHQVDDVPLEIPG